MKVIIVVVICSLSILSIQGKAVNDDEADHKVFMKEHVEDHKRFLNDMNKWLEDLSQNMKEELDRANNTLQLLPKTLLEDGKGQLIMFYAEALQQVEALPAPRKCITAGQLELMQLKKSSLESFAYCSNITTGLKDIAGMLLEVGKLAGQLVVTGDEIINGFTRCNTWNPIKFFWCTFNWVKDSVTDVYDTVKAIGEFNKNMGSLITDFKEEIGSCFHKSKAQALLHQLQVVDSINKCSA